MASTVFPVAAAAAAASTLGDGMTITAGTAKKVVRSYPAGTYTLTCISSTVAYVTFYSGSTEVGRTKTVSGTITYSLPSAADQALFSVDTGTSISVSLTQTANTQAGTSGTVQIFTTSGNLAAGTYYVTVIGGGGSGGGSSPNNNNFGGGGGSGGMASGYLTFNTTTAYTVGAAGGISTLSNLTANAGNAGGYGANAFGGVGTGGTPGGVDGSGRTGGTLLASQSNGQQALTGNTVSYGAGGTGAGASNTPAATGGTQGAIYVLAL